MIYDHHIESLHLCRERSDTSLADLKKLLVQRITEFDPDIVGISAIYFMNSNVVHDTVQWIKFLKTGICLVMGGIYPTASPGLALADKNVDFIICGEGEYAFRDFLEWRLGRRPFNELMSIGFRKGDELEIRKQGPFVTDLDEIGFPDRQDLPIGKYSIWGRTFVERFYKKDPIGAALQPTRGCPFHCTFCSGHVITHRRFRKRSVQEVVREMRELRDRHGIEIFFFNDEIANADTKWCLELYQEIIRERLGVKWVHGGGFYVHLMSEEFIDKALESGLLMFTIAIESGSRRVLKLVKKTEKIIDRAPKVIEMIRRRDPNIYITGFFVVGFPFETREDLDTTIAFAEELDVDWALFNIFQPFPGSELYDYCLQNGHLDSADSLSRQQLIHYLSSPLKNTTVPAREMEEIVYRANLSINFVHSRCLRTQKYEQAARDYERVISIAPEHALAHLCLARAYEGLNQNEQAYCEKGIVKEILKSRPEQRNYFDHFGLKI